MLSLNLINKGKIKELTDALSERKDVSAFGLCENQRYMISSLLPSFVYVCADFVGAKKAYNELKCLRDDVVYLPAKDDVLTYARLRKGEDKERLRALTAIVTGKAKAIVTYSLAIMQLFPDHEEFSSHCFSISKGDSLDLVKFTSQLVKMGYKREAQLSDIGQFAVRGDILDISPPTVEEGVRIEFFGDEIETIRLFDYSTQTSISEEETIELCPACEAFCTNVDITSDAPVLSGENRVRLDSIIQDITVKLAAGVPDSTLAFIMPLLKHDTFDKFVNLPFIVYDDAKQVVDNVNMHYREHITRYTRLLPEGEVLISAKEQLNKNLSYSGTKLAFHKLTTANRIFTPQEVFNYKSTPLTFYGRNREQLIRDVSEWKYQRYEILIFAGSEGAKDVLEREFAENAVSGINITSDYLDGGAIFHDIGVVIIGTGDIIVKRQLRPIKRKRNRAFDAAPGDFVVHEIHGIGVFESIDKMEMGESVRDYAVVRYRDGDKLFVPVENLDSLSRYNAEGGEPKLNKIGGAEFDKIKQRAKKAVKSLAFDLLELYSQRSLCKGYKYSADNSFLREFEAAFPFVETEDQLSAVEDGLTDLISGKVMDRLLCGDVGYGKTEVALRLAFKVISEGKQAAFISPTTILAKQHVRTAVQRMEDFGVRTCSLTRFDKPNEIKKSLEGLKNGTIDFAVGTHRLLSKDVQFKDLGLLILDEEQRFGVEDKEKIKNVKKDVNVLTLSATPIPRTLHMSMIGIRDISVLETPPADRIPVQTYVSEYSDGLVTDAVLREINRGGQVFIVYNKVAQIATFAAHISEILPSVRISVAHGQMPENVLEKTILDFVEGGADVLIASTIIENGIDIPAANTMIVVDADRFGLSQLYQLRGRIGRSDRVAYIFFTFRADKQLSETAFKRLEAITEFTEFGSGYKLAVRDLEIRGAGSILGKEQHGHMEKVGYEMYCKLLKESVSELRGESEERKKEVKVTIDFQSFLPDGYVPDKDWRIRIYNDIACLHSLEEAEKLAADIKDIYGDLPISVKNLILTGLAKNLAVAVGADKLIFKTTECAVIFDRAKEISPELIKKVEKTPFCSLVVNDKSGIYFKTGASSRKNLIKFLS